MSDWNDLRHVLAVMRAGSTLSAADRLGTSQSTVMRRIAACEAELGLALFDKLRSGYRPTAALRALAPALEATEAAHRAFDLAAAALVRETAGIVRLTAPELLATHLLAPLLAELRALEPDIAVELVTSNAFLDLEGGEADIALRAGGPPRPAGLFGRRLVTEDRWSICCSRAYAAAHGRPATLADLAGHRFIVPIDGFVHPPFGRWVDDAIPAETILIRQSSLSAIHADMKAGRGLAPCPDILARADPDIIVCLPVELRLGKEIWLLAPERHRGSRPVRRVLDHLGSRLAAVIREAERA